MKYVVSLLLLALVVLHQDFYWWHTHEPLVMGFLPIGLAWHAGISLAAGLLGLLAVKYCWPKGVDESDPAPSKQSNAGGGHR